MSSDVEPMAGKVVNGSIWMIGLRGSMRLLGFVSTIILARLLTPDDFGLIAMGLMAAGFVAAMTDANSTLALVRQPDPRRAHYDTAWTINVILAAGAGLIITAMAPFAALYFDDGRITPMLLVIALSTAIGGFENIGITDFMRHFQFHRQFLLQFLPRIVAFVLTVGAAFVWRSYWALVLGIFARPVIGVIVSYIIHPYRPRFSLAARAEMLGFSIWSSVGSLGSFLNQRIDQFLLGGAVTPARLGYYYLAVSVSEMATRELVAPLNPVVYAAYSRIHDDVPRLRNAFAKAIGAAGLLGFAASLGLYSVAEQFVLAVYGDQWAGAVALLQILSLSALGVCTRSVTAPLLVAQGRQRTAILLGWGQVAVSAAAMPAAYWYAEMQGVAWSRTAIEIGCAIASLVLALTPYKGLVRVSVRISARLFAAAVIMALVIHASELLLPLPPVLSLCMNVPLGAASYAAAVLLLWGLAGRPTGVESEILEHGRAAVQRLFGRFRRA